MKERKTKYEKKWYKGLWSKKQDGTIVTDEEVAKYTWKHLRLRDMFNIKAITSAVMESHAILMGDLQDPGEKYKFGDIDGKEP